MRIRLLIKRSPDDINPLTLEYYTTQPLPEAIAEEACKALTAQSGLHFDATGIRQIIAGLQRLIASNWARLLVGEGQPMEYLLPAPPLRDPLRPQRDQPLRHGPPAPPARNPQSLTKQPPPAAEPPTAPKAPPSTPQPAPDAKPSPQGKAMKPLNRD